MLPEEDTHNGTLVFAADDDDNMSFIDVYGNETDGVYEFYAAPQIVFVSTLCVFIVVGNSCVLAAIRLSQTGRKSRMNFFIMHLALADLLVGVMVSLTDLATKITIEWYAGDVMCKIIQYAQAVVTYASTYMLVSLSIDRYDAVARPMNFSRSGYQGRFLVYMAWLVSFVFALPALFIYTENEQDGKKQCWMDFPELWHWQLFITAVAVVTFLIPAVMIASCYIAIIYIIWSKGQSLEPHCAAERIVLQQTGSATSVRMTINDRRHETGRGIIPQAKIRTIKMTLIIVIVFILCWSPYFLYNLLDVYELLPINNPLTTLIQSAAPLNSAANPIIYGIFSTRICKNLRRIPMPFCLRKLICHCKETKKWSRFALRGRNPKLFASQTTDPTLTTNEAHKKCNHCLNDVRSPPLKASDRRITSLLTKHFLDRAIFTEIARDMPHQRDQDKKRKLFRLSRNKWIADKPGVEFEMAPLSKNRLGHLGSSASDDSSLTSDSTGRFPASKRVLELKILCERNEQSPRVSIKKMNTKESILNSSSEEMKVSLDKEEDARDNTMLRRDISEKVCTNYNISTTHRLSSSASLDVDHKGEVTVENQGRQLSEISYQESRHGSTSFATQEEDEEFSDHVFQQENDNDALPNNNSSSDNKENTTCLDVASSRPSASQEPAYDRPLATRRPSGVPTVRRRLTSDDNALLNNIANKWLVNEVNANESSVI